MMMPQDAVRLAYTKLKTRKVRLVVTLFVSSMLFSVLVAASSVVQGITKGIEAFNKEGFGSRYIVTGSPTTYFYQLSEDPALIDKANALYQQLVDKKKAEAKRLGLEYDPKMEQPYVMDSENPGGKVKMLNLQIPAVQQLVQEKMATQKGMYPDFEAMMRRYQSVGEYKSTTVTGAMYSQTYLKHIKDNVEDFSVSQNQAYNPNELDGLSTQWQAMSGALLAPFTLPGQNLDIGSDGSVPIIAPYSSVEKLLKLEPLPQTATAEQQLERLKELREKAGGYTFTMCYRNAASAQDVSDAQSQQAEIERNKSDKQYKLPALVKDVPATACGPIVVTRDVRTADEKKLAEKQLEFDTIFGKQAPTAQMVTFRIVGINADVSMGNGASIVEILKSIVTSSLGAGWFTPYDSAKANPITAGIFEIGTPFETMHNQTYYGELPSAELTRSLLKNENCQPDYSNFNPSVSMSDPALKCVEEGKYFYLMTFGSSSTGLDDFKKVFAKVFTGAGLVVAAFAALIMMGTLGRIIADSRRETAVFRAIGARRSDIAQLYLTYTLFLAILISGLSLAVGLLFASFVDNRYSEQMTVASLVTFNIGDLTRKFHLIAINARDLAYVVGFIAAAALISAVLPLMSNLRRNPIKDMRDER